ncbi:MAG: DUF1638 domain-containing protein [Clostridia bacterium]|nr:DUF1638 domain-containing protein [Clostridia bacterium]
MRLKLIACKALFRELSYIAARSENAVDITWMRQGYHNHPDQLRQWLQKEIDAVEAGEDPHTIALDGDEGAFEDFDAILLGYGLCSNATTGLVARRHRLVIPRAHDCITLFLGSKERYTSYFHQIPGCFWYTASWIENARMPGQASYERMARKYEEMGYDEDTVEYLLTEMGGLNNYHHAAYIAMPFLDNGKYSRVTQEAAAFYGWDYHEIEGRTSLLERFIAGDWNEEDFLVLEPGQSAVQAVGEGIIAAAPETAGG